MTGNVQHPAAAWNAARRSKSGRDYALTIVRIGVAAGALFLLLGCSQHPTGPTTTDEVIREPSLPDEQRIDEGERDEQLLAARRATRTNTRWRSPKDLL